MFTGVHGLHRHTTGPSHRRSGHRRGIWRGWLFPGLGHLESPDRTLVAAGLACFGSGTRRRSRRIRRLDSTGRRSNVHCDRLRRGRHRGQHRRLRRPVIPRVDIWRTPRYTRRRAADAAWRDPCREHCRLGGFHPPEVGRPGLLELPMLGRAPGPRGAVSHKAVDRPDRANLPGLIPSLPHGPCWLSPKPIATPGMIRSSAGSHGSPLPHGRLRHVGENLGRRRPRPRGAGGARPGGRRSPGIGASSPRRDARRDRHRGALAGGGEQTVDGLGDGWGGRSTRGGGTGDHSSLGSQFDQYFRPFTLIS